MLARARAATLTNFHAVARHVGLEPYLVLREAGLNANSLSDPENWIPAGRLLSLLEHCSSQSERDDFGVLLGDCRTFASLGPVSLLLCHESTLGEIIAAAMKYRRLLNELLQFRLHLDGHSAILEWSLIPGLRSSQGMNLLATVAYRVFVDGPACNWQPDCVHFRHASPVHRSSFSRVFRCPLEFNSTFDGMSFASTCLALPNDFADAELAAHARRLLDLMPGVRRHDTMSQRVAAAIPLLISGGQADVESVSHDLGTSVRTLQRRLIAEGQSFSSLLNDARCELAVRYLRCSDLSITSIAGSCGFSALSSFTRWFISEFGVSPRQWRNEAPDNETSFVSRARAETVDVPREMLVAI
ncbi:MAG: AraC family transcriptional regulator ligand-binding domain-containing protein [Sphingomicrobium sp.]